jgi:hypothetical protein
MLVRAEHAGRHARGETFAISAKAMAKARVFGQWAPKRYVKARNVLLDLGYIEKVSEGRRGKAAQYRLKNRMTK